MNLIKCKLIKDEAIYGAIDESERQGLGIETDMTINQFSLAGARGRH